MKTDMHHVIYIWSVGVIRTLFLNIGYTSYWNLFLLGSKAFGIFYSSKMNQSLTSEAFTNHSGMTISQYTVLFKLAHFNSCTINEQVLLNCNNLISISDLLWYIKHNEKSYHDCTNVPCRRVWADSDRSLAVSIFPLN